LPAIFPPRSPRLSVPTVALVVLVTIAALCGVLAILATTSELPELDLRPSPGWAALAVIGFVGVELYHAALWRAVLARLGGRLSLTSGLAVWSLSSLGRWVPSSFPLPVIRILGARRAGVAGRLTAASIAYEGAFSVLAALLCASLLLADAPPGVGVGIGIAVAALAVVSVDPRVFRRLADALLHRLGREGLPSVLTRRELLGFLIAFAASFVLAGLAVFATAEALFEVGPSDLPAAISSFAAGFLASLLFFVLPAGVGAREAGMTGVLSAQMPVELAIAVSVVVRLTQIVVEFAVAGVTAALARRERRRARAAPAGQPSAKRT
jgi:glycosyltransferase 2 family protein